ncbi:MAG: hypothetical protein AAFN81_11000 [Bacteroidota bacterium]
MTYDLLRRWMYFSILLGVSLLLACEKDNQIVEQWENGVIKKELIAGVDKFLVREFYEDGSLESEGFVGKDTVTKNGEWIYKSEQGNTSRIVNYVNGNRWGTYQFFHPNGALASIGTYDEFGTENGEWTTFYPDSTMESTGKYKGGKKISQWRYYHDNGTISIKEDYSTQGDELVKSIQYDEYGIIHNIQNYTDGLLRRELLTGQDTVLGAKEIQYYPNGNKEMEGYKLGNHLVGKWHFWYSSGNKYAEGEFASEPSQFDGYVWQSYYPIEELPINHILDGIRIGKWKYWKESGKELGYCNFKVNDRNKSITCSCRIR